MPLVEQSSENPSSSHESPDWSRDGRSPLSSVVTLSVINTEQKIELSRAMAHSKWSSRQRGVKPRKSKSIISRTVVELLRHSTTQMNRLRVSRTLVSNSLWQSRYLCI